MGERGGTGSWAAVAARCQAGWPVGHRHRFWLPVALAWAAGAVRLSGVFLVLNRVSGSCRTGSGLGLLDTVGAVGLVAAGLAVVRRPGHDGVPRPPVGAIPGVGGHDRGPDGARATRPRRCGARPRWPGRRGRACARVGSDPAVWSSTFPATASRIVDACSRRDSPIGERPGGVAGSSSVRDAMDRSDESG
jgi:hypothetical protein